MIQENLIKLFNKIASKINNDEDKNSKSFSEFVVQSFIDFEEEINVKEKTEEDFELLKKIVFVEF